MRSRTAPHFMVRSQNCNAARLPTAPLLLSLCQNGGCTSIPSTSAKPLKSQDKQ
ncbi:hypothetical protein EMPG_13481 [Blastomyces silverae]|uniref:Uncharacterized protein n=1 Tax=Blastomyces silverae TaxID=2060906 RepID=A0A0H1BJL4_9EURO|nr:hypothetical protein EMPG_13481 [Blastomyces silverae]